MQLEKVNSEKLKFKEERDFNLNELSKFRENCKEVNNKLENLKVDKSQNEEKFKKEMEVIQNL